MMPQDALSHRHRLLAALRREPADRLPDLEFGAWTQTIDRWAEEGMDLRQLAGVGAPQNYLEHYFQTDDTEYGPALDVRVGVYPPIDEEILETRGDHQIVRDKDGATVERLDPAVGASIPRYLRFAIENRSDWERFRDERLNPEEPRRIPVPVDALARRFRDVDYPVVINAGSLYGYLRNWMGVERLSLALFDDRPWIEEMMEHLTRLTLRVLERLEGAGLQIDRADWWEDMCYRAGPLLSPRMFRELMSPRYKKVTASLKEAFGVEFNQVDCDGNIHALVALWADCGINVMFPLEAAHSDPFRATEQLGASGSIRGAFNKLAMISGPVAIDAEFDRLLPLIRSGRLIPHTDHRVPPDVSFANYLYYRRRKCELLGKPWREPGVPVRRNCLREWRLLADPAGESRQQSTQSERIDASAGREFPALADGAPILLSQAPSGYVEIAPGVAEARHSVQVTCTIESPDERSGWLDLGSDGPIRAWLNGVHIWNNDLYRDAAPGQDLVPVQLCRGNNDLILDVSPGKHAWGFHGSVVDAHGRPWPDLAARA